LVHSAHELEGIQEEMLLAYLKVLSWHLTGHPAANIERFQ